MNELEIKLLIQGLLQESDIVYVKNARINPETQEVELTVTGDKVYEIKIKEKECDLAIDGKGCGFY